MSAAATALLLALAGYGYLALVGTATMLVILPRQYLPYRVLLAPLFGWAALVALGYPLSAVLPFRVVAPAIALAACSVIAVAALRNVPTVTRLVAGRRAWREAAWPFALTSVTYVAAVRLHARQSTLTALVVDSDAEHFADVIASLLHFPTGWSVEAYRGLEITPIGFGYHAIHAMLSAVTGIDVFTTALPSHFLLSGLAVPAVYFFARRSLALTWWAAAIAVALYCLGPIPLIVASFGWGQQTAALAAVPFGIACLLDGLNSHDRRMVFAAGLAVGLATGSLYLATTPLLVGTAAIATLLISLRAAKEWRRGGGNGYAGRISWFTRSGSFGAILAPWRRVMLIGAVALAAGSFSHLGAASYLLERIGAGLVTDEEMQHRSVHVPQFASPLAAIGVAPLDLFGTIVAADRQTALEWQDTPFTRLGALGGGVLLLIGTLRVVRIRAFGLSLLAAALAYEAYLRVLRPFPYGEFKLLSSIWFLVPCLAAAGLVGLQRVSHHRRPVGRALVGRTPVPVGIVAGVLASALFGAGLVQSQTHAQRFLSEPWGAAIPAAAMADARAVAQAVPQGSSVFVSNLLTLDTALAWHGKPTSGRPQGFPSAEARAIYLGKRWRGIVTSFLSMTGRPVYGLVQRETGELRLPVSPGATDYLLLDALEDPMLHGVLPADQVMAQGTLRLYRRVSRPAAATRPLNPSAASAYRTNGTPMAALLSIRGTGSELVDIDAADGSGTRAIFSLAPLNSLPRASLPISPIPVAKELPAARRSLNLRNGIQAQPAAVLSLSEESAGAPSRGQVIIGFHVIAPSHVDISFRDAGEPSGESRGQDDLQNQPTHERREVRRRLVLLPGLTWYTTPALQWPAEVHVARVAGESVANAAQANSVWPVIVMSASSGTAPVAEQLEKSAAGSSFPLLTVSSHSEVEGQLTLDAWYSHPGAQEGRWRARLRNSETLWLGGTAIPTAFHPGAGNRHWRITLAPGEAPEQWASDDRSAPEAGAIWQPTSDHHWLWLEIGPYREPAPYEVPMPVLSWSLSGAPSRAPFAAAVFPLLREPPPGLGVADGSLVKGSGEDLFYVDQGRLRWVSSPDVLARRNIPWNLTILEDRALWQLPAALPLT